ncbi:uncharacterized protein [Miscanthus floridulus]|uniref:uncharacterized protein n=1 Tax=Miscanthus floridulus TaxID=154761 RepID=UPI003459B350
MESPCTNHTYPIKHLYNDCELLKRFLWQAAKLKEGKGKEEVAKKGRTAGRYPLIVDPIIRKKHLTKVLMDEDSDRNILYIDTLDAMHIPWSELCSVSSPFHGMILGVQAYPLRQIDLPLMFGDRANFCSEVQAFEVVDFLGSYHAILGWPYYAKFMAIPNYTYLKLKMLGPNSVITIGSTFSHANMCDHEHYELVTAVINSAELPKLKNSTTPVVPDYNGSTSSSGFHPTKETKAVEIDPTDPTKMVRIGIKLLAK